MTHFRRTAGGLASLHLFFRTELVAFCEGGPSATKEQAILPALTDKTLDVIYWEHAIKVARPQLKVHVKSVGSKSTLKSIAGDIDRYHLSTVSVCLDRDYDVLLGRNPSYVRIAYTKGYSWENDVLSREALINAIETMIGPLKDDIIRRLDGALARTSRDLAFWGQADIVFYSRSKPCLLDREKPVSLIDENASPPSLNLALLNGRLRSSGCRRRPPAVVRVAHDEALMVGFGRLCSNLLYRVVKDICAGVMRGIRLDYTTFMRIVTAETFRLVRDGKLMSLRDHHLQQASAF